ncbi:MAG: YifB family Mg chelatase-like AAA ATPase [Bradymonadia bacterium]
MLASAYTAVSAGLNAHRIQVEVDIGRGMRTFTIVGLPANSVSESRTRVKSALVNSGYTFPKGRVTCNLAPGDIRKQGTGLDLAIAIAILSAQGRIAKVHLAQTLLLGEVALDGRLLPATGALPSILKAKSLGFTTVISPPSNASLAAHIEGITSLSASHLGAVVEHLCELHQLPLGVPDKLSQPVASDIDFAEVCGQQRAVRAAEIAVAGRHNLLMAGPPGCGKSMIAKRLATLLPPMTANDRLQNLALYQLARLEDGGRAKHLERPFRAPHHTISRAGLVGGSGDALPGEISLANHGILFLDELPEFSRPTLECLRQPLEDQQVTIARASIRATYPCAFILIAAMNPCPCGYLGHATITCDCSHNALARYRQKLSGPLIDRFGLQVDLQPVPTAMLRSPIPNESSRSIRKRIEAARKFRCKNGETCLSERQPLSKLLAQLESAATSTLESYGRTHQLSARGLAKTLSIARTIATLDQRLKIGTEHLSEALSYRQTLTAKGGPKMG